MILHESFNTQYADSIHSTGYFHFLELTFIYSRPLEIRRHLIYFFLNFTISFGSHEYLRPLGDHLLIIFPKQFIGCS